MTKRYSRNPIISRTLVEFGIVRELNEGVKRMYNEMEKDKLPKPLYTKPDRNSVLLILKNNIEKREKNVKINDNMTKVWDELNYLEQKALNYITNNESASREEIGNVIGRSKTSTITVLNHLINKKLIVWTGTSKSDRLGKYILK